MSYLNSCPLQSVSVMALSELVSSYQDLGKYWWRKSSKRCNTPVCDVCKEQIGDIKYIALSDGRQLCPDCSYIAVIDPEDCKPLINSGDKYLIWLDGSRN
ncbi:hypothetical protein CQW23_26277 [Capsicum baccatum]|uniref:Uncharacterized protein n=1 Tax=Capsicum baccatum TaxID=33114 RepID=A0A2G2VNC1_CAPBA|nr:hypothetical protein CQW23_26277 [Capsicum baccatum]